MLASAVSARSRFSRSSAHSLSPSASRTPITIEANSSTTAKLTGLESPGLGLNTLVLDGVDVNILLRERECYSFLVETLFDRFCQVEHDAPVIGGLDPGANHEIHTAVGEGGYGNRTGRLVENAVLGSNEFLNGVTDLVEIVVVTHSDHHIDTTSVVGRVVGDDAVHDLAIGDDYLLIVAGLQHRRQDLHLLN